MKNIRFNILITCMLVLLACVVPFLISSTLINVQQSYPAKMEVTHATSSPEVPRQLTFAGQQIDLSRYDRRERMDRELTTFTYMHTTTLLMIKRANRFFPAIEPILKANGIPDDFKYLMVIESNLNTLARSPAGAAGLWQFMESTGREFGLEVNSNIDERYHVEKSTRAACKYLKDSYAQYGDWITVAASYNAGLGRISSELRQQQAKTAMDLWLNEETSRYIFRMMAAKMVFTNPQQYGFLLKKENLYPVIPYEKTKVNTAISDLTEFARQKGITYAQLKDANPWLRGRSLENKSRKEYILNIPTKEGMNYNPGKTVPHDKNWVISASR